MAKEQHRQSKNVSAKGKKRREPGNPDMQDFWWLFFQRHDTLKERLGEWHDDRSTDLATREGRIAELEGLVAGMDYLAHLDSLHPETDELAGLKQWYRQATTMDRQSWARAYGPNVPSKVGNAATPETTTSVQIPQSMGGHAKAERSRDRKDARDTVLKSEARKLIEEGKSKAVIKKSLRMKLERKELEYLNPDTASTEKIETLSETQLSRILGYRRSR